MTTIAAASPLLSLADPAAMAGAGGDGFAPVLAALLASASVAPPGTGRVASADPRSPAGAVLPPGITAPVASPASSPFAGIVPFGPAVISPDAHAPLPPPVSAFVKASAPLPIPFAPDGALRPTADAAFAARPAASPASDDGPRIGDPPPPRTGPARLTVMLAETETPSAGTPSDAETTPVTASIAGETVDGRATASGAQSPTANDPGAPRADAAIPASRATPALPAPAGPTQIDGQPAPPPDPATTDSPATVTRDDSRAVAVSAPPLTPAPGEAAPAETDIARRDEVVAVAARLPTPMPRLAGHAAGASRPGLGIDRPAAARPRPGAGAVDDAAVDPTDATGQVLPAAVTPPAGSPEQLAATTIPSLAPPLPARDPAAPAVPCVPDRPMAAAGVTAPARAPVTPDAITGPVPTAPTPDAPAIAPPPVVGGQVATAPTMTVAIRQGTAPADDPAPPRAFAEETILRPDVASPARGVPPIATSAPVAPTILPALQAFGAALHRAAAAERRSLRDPAAEGIAAIAPPTPATAATVAPPVDTTVARWPDAMIARIEALRDQQNAPGTPGDARIRLHPDALGTVDVTLRQDAAGTHVQLHAAEPATVRLLADALPRLQDLAETRGLRLAGTDIAGAGGQAATGQGWAGDRRQPPPAPLPAPTPAPRRPTAAPARGDDASDTRLA